MGSTSMNILPLAVSFAVGMSVVLLATPHVMKFSERLGLYDRVDQRKIHGGRTSRLGGVAMFGGAVVAMAAGLLVDGVYTVTKAAALGAGFSLVFAVSLWDDIRGLPWWVRLIAQAIGAAVFASVTVRPMVRLNLPFVGVFSPGLWSYPIVVLWLMMTTNAMNLIDGTDGLAAGIATIAGTVLLVSAVRNGLRGPAMLAAVTVGVCAGFLPYNLPPARIFMGDAGATLLGFTLGASSLTGAGKNVGFMSLLIPILALAVPLFDVVSAVIRRSSHGRSVFEADRQHIHHVLLSVGLSPRRTLFLLYSITAVLGAIGLSLAGGPRTTALLMAVLLGLGALFVIGRRRS
jgi:UDP-GlcNAc:undecaprenyl-phosphate/decaprenyl-phosphate GlcNAc-1-phosphate transferase